MRQSSEAQALSESEKNKLRKALSIFDKALLITPVMDKFALGILLRDMIRGGTIKKENVNPALLQSFSIPIEKPEVTRILTETAARRAREIEKAPEEKPEEPQKPGFFKRLFGKKPKKPKKPKPPKPKKEPKPEEIIPPKIEEAAQRLGKIPSIYKGKISPYEQKREVGPTHIGRIIPPSPRLPLEKRIPTFPEKTKQAIKKLEKEEKKEKKEKPQKVDIKGKYRIQTMKKDIEKAKQALPRPEPKVKNNIVDLSGK
jgi:hypothetical protein